MKSTDAFDLIVKIEKVIYGEVRKAGHSVQEITAYAKIGDTMSVYRAGEGDSRSSTSPKRGSFVIYSERQTSPKDRGFFRRLFGRKKTPKAKSEITFFVDIKGRISNYEREEIIRDIEERLAELDIQKPDMEIHIYLD